MLPAVLLAVAFGAGTGGAAEPEPWQTRGDVVFRPVPQAADEPVVVLPTSMEQDADGFLWAGGETGLLRWDGYRFAAYTAARKPADGLPHHGIVAMHRDKGGTLWVGTLAGNLARYDPATDRFTPVKLASDDGQVQSVWSIDDDGGGGLWVATNAGLFQLEAAGRTVRHLRHDPAAASSLPDDQIQAVLRDRRGRIWVGGRHGLAWADPTPDALKFHEMPLPGGGADRAEVSHLLQDSLGRLWVGTRAHGAYVIASDGVAGRIAATAGGGDTPPVEITAIAEVTPGRIWLGTFGRGIVAVRGEQLQTRFLRHDPGIPGTLGSDSVWCLFTDQSGLTWVGTTVGISLFNPGSGGLTTMFARQAVAGATGGPASGNVTGFDITAIVARPDGGLWLGSEANGIDILDAAGRNRRNLNLQRVFCMLATGDLLLAGTRDGLYQADPGTSRITRLAVPGRRINAGVFALYRSRTATAEGAEDLIWLGGGDDGLWGVRFGADGQLNLVRHIDAPALTSSVVHVIAAAPGGRIAAGTDNGFNLIDPATGDVERVLHDPADPASLGAGGVVSLATDARGRLWAGNDQGGINIMLGRRPGGAPIFRHIGIAEGLANLDIDAMLPDAKGRMWLSTDNGLAVVDPANFSVRTLAQADGVAVTGYWNDSAARTVNGTIVFGGTGGLTFVQPEAVQGWAFNPPVRITGLRLGGSAVWPARGPAPNHGTPWQAVPPEVNAIAAEFASLDFSAPERNRYRYRLVGFDAGWTETDAAHRVAAYTNLPPGDYTLQVQGSNRAGRWSENAATLPIRVLPDWYQTLSFHLIEALAAGVAVAALVQARTLVLRRRQHELERLVDERTGELRTSERRLQEFAYVDALTGLPNRRAFNEHMDRLIAATGRQPAEFALILIDLDGFKQVNDTLGHDAGDAVLVEAAARLIQAVRQGDFVARLGGDEFCLAPSGTQDMATLEMICGRVVDGMAAPLGVAHGPVRIGASLGAALFPRHGGTPDELYQHADLALYAAKRAGKGAWRWYEENAA